MVQQVSVSMNRSRKRRYLSLDRVERKSRTVLWRNDAARFQPMRHLSRQGPNHRDGSSQ